MDGGRPDRVRHVGFRSEAEPVPAINPMRVIAGLAAILFPVLNVIPFNFIDIERYNPSNNVAGALFLLAYVLLLPLVYVLYQELRAVSRPLSAGMVVLGVGVPVGVATGVIGGLNITIASTITVSCLSLWIGLAGYLALSGRRLGRAWGVFSVAIAALALVTAVLTVVLSISSGVTFLAWSIYGLAVGVWVLWTGVMFLRHARVSPAGA